MLDRIPRRETKEENNLFFTCSLIEYIARRTKNSGRTVTNLLGKSRVEKIFELADVYHCENIDAVADDFIEQAEIPNGNFDPVQDCHYSPPDFWDIGRVYEYVIMMISKNKNLSIIESIFEAYNSIISEKMDNYNSAFYYDAPENIFLCYCLGRVI